MLLDDAVTDLRYVTIGFGTVTLMAAPQKWFTMALRHSPILMVHSTLSDLAGGGLKLVL